VSRCKCLLFNGLGNQNCRDQGRRDAKAVKYVKNHPGHKNYVAKVGSRDQSAYNQGHSVLLPEACSDAQRIQAHRLGAARQYSTALAMQQVAAPSPVQRRVRRSVSAS
jgi:hypothetical protein